MSKKQNTISTASVTDSPITAPDAIATLSNVSFPSLPDFKSHALAESANIIAQAVNATQMNAYAVAKELGKIKAGKTYEEDGFKSVKDFAHDVFGINRSQAYAWANVGERFLNNDNPDFEAIRHMPVSNAAVISSLTDEEIKSGIESGKITSATTQARLREFVSDTVNSRPVDEGAPKVLPMFEYVAFIGSRSIPSVTSMLEDDISGAVSSAVGYSTLIEEHKLPDIKSDTKGAPSTKRRLLIFVDDVNNPVPVMVEYRMAKTPSKTSKKMGAKSIHDMSAAELAELLRAAQEREAKAAGEVEG